MKEAKPVARIDLSTMSDLDELVLCRSANQIKVYFNVTVHINFDFVTIGDNEGI